MHRHVNVAGGGGGEPVQTPNVIAFDYDVAGNQIKRKPIYINSGVYKTTNNAIPTSNELIKSDLYADISYYPNPVKEELFLKWLNPEKGYVMKLKLSNMNGQLLKQYEVSKTIEEITIDFQSYPQGFYTLILFYNNGEQKTLKIIKQ